MLAFVLVFLYFAYNPVPYLQMVLWLFCASTHIIKKWIIITTTITITTTTQACLHPSPH
jgi:hypothetical protein